MTKRHRADSVTEAVAAAQASSRPIEPPPNVPLTDADLPFFASVIAEFARDEWTEHQLELAAMLAIKMRLLRDELRTLESEGFVGKTANDTPCQNPRLGGVRMLDTSIMASRRSMSLQAHARAGDARDIGKRRALKKSHELTDDDDDLLARPN